MIRPFFNHKGTAGMHPMFHARRGVAAAAVIALASIAGTAAAALEIGKPAPQFTGVDSNGKQLSLAQFRGKTVVLEWTNHDCPYVARQYGTGNMQKLQAEAATEGVVWISVISSAPGTQGHVSGAEANELSKSRGASPAGVVLDESGKIGRMYGAVTTPHMYIVDAKGSLVYQGAIDSDATTWGGIKEGTENYVQGALAAMKSGKPVKPAYTRPYGCTVKYGS